MDHLSSRVMPWHMYIHRDAELGTRATGIC